MDVNEHVRLSNITLRNISKQRNSAFIAIPNFTATVEYSTMSTKIPQNECEMALSLQLSSILFDIQKLIFTGYLIPRSLYLQDISYREAYMDRLDCI
jgi:hypothetical protein